MQERTLEQERKGLKQEVHDYLCLSAAKKLSKTITFLDKKWSNEAYGGLEEPQGGTPPIHEKNFNV